MEPQVELTAQIIWSTAFGLALRLIIEHVDETQQKRLIDHTANFVLHALKGLVEQNREEAE